MTFRSRRLFVGVALGLCVLVAACTRPENNVGASLLPEQDLLNLLTTDTVTLEVSMVLDTAVLTDEIDPVLCCNYMDPSLGSVKGSFYTQLRLEAANPDFGPAEEFILDSMVLVLGFDEAYPLPDRAWQPGFDVHLLSEDLHLDSTYTSNDALAFAPESLEEDPFAVYPLRTVTDSIGGELEDPQVRIRLNGDFADLIMAATEDDLATSDAFVSYLPGIYVQLEETTSNQCFLFDLEDGTSRIEMYYRTGAVDDQDTTQFAFTINNNTAHFTSVERTYSGFAAPFEAGEVDGGIPVEGGHGYVTGGAGFGLKIRFPHLTDFNALAGRNINRAELIVPTGASDSDQPTHEGMILRFQNEDGELELIGDHNTLINIDGGYESATEDYRFVLTRHIQDIINGDVVVPELLLLSTHRQNQLLRNVLNGPEVGAEGTDRNMRLILTLSY